MFIVFIALDPKARSPKRSQIKRFTIERRVFFLE